MKTIEVNVKKLNSALKEKGIKFSSFTKAAPSLGITTICKIQGTYPLELNLKESVLIQKALKKLKFSSKEISEIIEEKIQSSLF